MYSDNTFFDSDGYIDNEKIRLCYKRIDMLKSIKVFDEISMYQKELRANRRRNIWVFAVTYFMICNSENNKVSLMKLWHRHNLAVHFLAWQVCHR